jgi:beta-glucanase (GH16 family)
MKNKRKFSWLLILLISVLGFGLSSSRATAASLLVDFEGGLPGGWFQFSGGGASVSTAAIVVADSDPLARPGQVGNNTILEATHNATSGFAGFGQDFSATTGSQNWINFSGVSFWMYGTNSGNTYQFEIFDNRSDPNTDTAERFDTLFSDDFSGWQHVIIPFSAFNRATDFQPAGAPNDGLTLTEMWGWAVPLDGNAGLLYLDDVSLEEAIIDDFESGLPTGTDGDGIAIGFVTFNDPNSTVAISTTDTPTLPVPGSAAGNHVMQTDTNVVNGGYAGFVHLFENDTADTWTPQNWSTFSGLSFWLYGNNTGSVLFIDILDNRNDGSTTDDAERWSIDITDDFSGWQFFELPWEAFHRKEIGNGAPNDGFTLTQVHGWAFGVFSSAASFTNYLDDVALFGVAETPELAVTFTANNYNVAEGATGPITVKLNRPMNAEDPAQVSVDYAIEPGTPIAGREYTPVSGTLTFINGSASTQTFPFETFDDSKYEGDERVIVRLSNPVDVELGFVTQSSATIVDNDAYDANLIDDFERYPYLWQASENVTLDNPEIADSDPQALPGQGAYEHVLEVTAPVGVEIKVNWRRCNLEDGLIKVILLSTPTFDASAVDHTTVTLGAAHEAHINRFDMPERHEQDLNNDGLMDLFFHFKFSETGLPCGSQEFPFNGWTYDGQPITGGGGEATFGRDFAIGQDWSFSGGLTFWYYGQNSGDTVTVELLDNRAADPGPGGWTLAWSDEFNEPAGSPPNPANWGHEIGDGTINGIPGWGNAELQYYTDSTDNAATDGAGNLVITAREADGSLLCYYGPCQYTSARLLSWHKAEFAYGRIESRMLLPDGDDGLWPAFWSLGTDIDLVGWPQTGEIDFMEYVSRLPEEIFGTIHGPGYAGGSSYGDTLNFPGGAAGSYHTITIEWQPDLIEWYIDGVLYHTATPADVAPNEWVFNDPVFLLLNMAIGGNFGGLVSPDTVFPQSYKIDYVRVYQGPDTAERFESTFVDDFTGWQQVQVPFSTFVRSAEQPAGAPNDGLGLTEVWGYGFKLPATGTATGTVLLDQVRLEQPSSVVVTNTNDDGEGSLRWAAEVVANGGTVTFDPALAGQTITLNGPLTIEGKELTIDGIDAPGIILSGGDVDRVLIVEGSGTLTGRHLIIADGYGWQLAGGILNNGTLTLDHVTVRDNTMATDAGDFWQGGGGIYSGDGATLNLIDSTVSNNTAAWSGGGVYLFFNSTTTIVRSTISGNTSNDVGGGVRSLGNVDIVNSTISGNTSTGWYGGAIFVTDGVVDLVNTTVAANTSPAWAAADVFVGTFTAANATLTLTNSIVSSAQGNCFFAPWGSGTVTLTANHNNVFTDSSCFAGASDQVVANAGLEGLANNGGPTQTHALTSTSPALEAADPAACPATDQRGVARPQGTTCDTGSFEREPIASRQ